MNAITPLWGLHRLQTRFTQRSGRQPLRLCVAGRALARRGAEADRGRPYGGSRRRHAGASCVVAVTPSIAMSRSTSLARSAIACRTLASPVEGPAHQHEARAERQRLQQCSRSPAALGGRSPVGGGDGCEMLSSEPASFGANVAFPAGIRSSASPQPRLLRSSARSAGPPGNEGGRILRRSPYSLRHENAEETRTC